MSTGTREIEAALMVCADAPALIADEVARMDRIAGSLLTDGGTIPMHDIMFDTVDRTLGSRGYVLRVRRTPGSDFLTLKGESRPSDWGGVQRLEIEGKSGSGIEKEIEAALGRAGIVLSFDPTPSADAIKVLRAAGLHAIQDRETLRHVRHLLGGSGVFAELAIDRVSARFGQRTAAFYQVEVEAKGVERAEALQDVVSALESRFEGRLVRWPFGKMATLFAIMRAARERGLEALVNAEGLLTAAGCVHVRAELERPR